VVNFIRFSKPRSIFDDDSDDDLFSTKKSSTSSKTVFPIKESKSLFDDSSPPPSKSSPLFPTLDSEVEVPPATSFSAHTHLAVEEKPVQEKPKPKVLILHS